MRPSAQKSWTASFISIVLYSCLIYVIVLLLKLFNFTEIEGLHPALVTSYMSLAHMATVPFLCSIQRGNQNCIWLINVFRFIIFFCNYFAIKIFGSRVPGGHSGEMIVVCINSGWIAVVVLVNLLLCYSMNKSFFTSNQSIQKHILIKFLIHRIFALFLICM